MVLFCVIDGAILADEVHLDLTGIFQIGFKALGNIVGDNDHLIIADQLRLNDDANLTAGLNGKGIFYAGEGVGDFFQLLQTFDIVFDVFTTGTGTGGRNGIGGLHQTSDDGFGFYIAVVSVNSMNNRFALAVFFSIFNT